MNRTTTLRRKLIYLVILVAMLIPLYLLGQPAGGKGDFGGELSEMRIKYNIAESDLGEISPASETMKLASLGLRGVAATLLWNKAHEYRVKHEWDRLKATLNNIALLQPHFDKVWEHQAHNLAYNVSSEFDDYRQRYEMVREGTEFLTRGVRQNRNAPRLIWYTGWFYGSKMGMSDEKVQFRRLFSDDEVLHEELLTENIAVDSPEARGPLGKPDNWLVGRLWLNRGYEMVDAGVKIRRQTPINFYETGPKWRFQHAEAIEKEGILDERAQNAWEMAAEDWSSFGNRSIPTTSPFTIKLDQLDVLERQKEEKIEQLRELVKEEFDAETKRLYDALPEVLKETYNKPREEMTHNDKEMYVSIKGGLVPNLPALARAADPAVRLRAIEIVGELDDLEERLIKTRGYRTQINYPYWKSLAQAEQEERTVRARRLIYEAEKANEDAELDKAIALYEESFAVWAEIFDDYPLLTVDDTAQDLFESLKRYSIAIDSEEMPEDFPLRTFVELMGEYGQIDSHMYTEIQAQAEEAMLARKKELAEEERLLEEAAKAEEEKARMEKAESEKAAKAKEKEAADKAAKEKVEKEKADAEPKADDSDKPEAESPNSENDSGEEASDAEGSDE
ncbi:IRE (iron responsive element) [Rubripirellula reticaptiva]|uniref:IRE (Iron responsive element) n=1 Tax=Rubripirellula reticaptiva TaxID=2528013 RepID=A0A5C6FAQ6_9BACT|nr:IRE (iron responsive element) [Rubripirellula reticaptiva]TWU57617.1 hypothetical protein Poly59_05240 [Rubripirellula reticaptiva]